MFARIKSVLFISVFLSILSSNAFSQHSAGLGVSILGDSDSSVNSAMFSYNYRPDSNMGLEIYGATGGSDSYQGISIDLDYLVGSKLKLGTEVGNTFFYVSGGYNVIGVSGSGYGASVSIDGDGAALGVGVDFDVSESIESGLSYQRFFGDIEDTNGWALVFRYKF